MLYFFHMPPDEMMEKPRMISVSTATFFKALLFVIGLWFLWYVRDIVAIILTAVLLAALIDPVADWFQKRRIPRGVAVVGIYIVLGAIVTAVAVGIVPVVLDELTQLIGKLTVLYQTSAESFVRFRAFSVEHGFNANVTSTLQSIQDGITGSFTSIFSTVWGFFGGLAAMFIALVLAFYMVTEEDATRRYFRTLAPVEYQPFLDQLLKKMQKKIGAWMRGQLLLGLIVGVAVYIGLRILGVEYALLLAIIAGFFEMIPYAGPVISVIPALVIGFASSPFKGFAVLVLYIVVQQLENNILVPKIMQRVTGLNPIVSIVALMVGIKLGGLAGAILSIPLATMGAVILEELFKVASKESV